MTNEDYIDELLIEAEALRLREYVIEMSLILREKNPRMDRCESIRLALENAKLHAGIPSNR